MPSILALKPIWTVAQWRAFGRRCQALRDRFDRFVYDFPPTTGWKAGTTDALLSFSRAFSQAMVKTENVIERQHPGADVIGIMFGDNRRDRPGKDFRGKECLSRAQWIALGRELKAIRTDLMGLYLDRGISLQKTKYATIAVLNYYSRAGKAIETVKRKLDSLCFAQHSGWEDFDHVFYGQDQWDGETWIRDC